MLTANRFPLTLDGTAIKEIPSGDNLDLTGSGITGAGTVALTNLTVGGSQGTDGQQAELHGVVQVQVKPLLTRDAESNPTPSANGLCRSLCTAAGVAQPMSLQPWDNCTHTCSAA